MIKRDLGGARTLDPLIKSQLLYQLSYEVKLHSGVPQGASFLNCDAKVQLFLNTASAWGNFFRNPLILPTRLHFLAWTQESPCATEMPSGPTCWIFNPIQNKKSSWEPIPNKERATLLFLKMIVDDS